MPELADGRDLGSRADEACGFESHFPHRPASRNLRSPVARRATSLSPPPALVRGDLTHSCATHRGCPPTAIHPRRGSSARGDRVCSSRAGYHGGIQFGATTPLWKRAHTERGDTYAEPPASDGPVTAPTRASDYRQLMRDEMPSLPSARAAQARGCGRTCQRIAAYATSRALAVPLDRSRALDGEDQR